MSALAATRARARAGAGLPALRHRAGPPVLPFAAGVLLLAAVAARAGQGGSRLNGNVRGLARAAGTDRDDDRFWKARLIYVNCDDPALVVGARFGVGWTLNFGNPVAWLVVAGFVAWWA